MSGGGANTINSSDICTFLVSSADELSAPSCTGAEHTVPPCTASAATNLDNSSNITLPPDILSGGKVNSHLNITDSPIRVVQPPPGWSPGVRAVNRSSLNIPIIIDAELTAQPYSGVESKAPPLVPLPQVGNLGGVDQHGPPHSLPSATERLLLTRYARKRALSPDVGTNPRGGDMDTFIRERSPTPRRIHAVGPMRPSLSSAKEASASSHPSTSANKRLAEKKGVG